MLLFLKLLVAPALVAAVTLAVRRWDPRVGGWLSGLPTVAGPVLVFFAIEQGPAFAAQAAHATLTGLIGTVAFAVVYARTCVRARWPACLLVGWSVFVATTYFLYWVSPPLVASLGGLFAASVLGRRVLPRVSEPPLSGRGHPRADLILRVAATATLVLVLTAIARTLGARLSGLLNAFPILTTIITAFTHAQRGSAATAAFVNGFSRSIIGFGLFCFVLSLALGRVGLLPALAMSLAVNAIVSSLALRFARRAVSPPREPPSRT